MLIHASHITVEKNHQSILKDVSLEIAEKDFITIVGPNGAGKSMLLKALLGFYIPDSGTVTRKKNLSIGYVPQRMVPEHVMPVNVEYFLKLYARAELLQLEALIEELALGDLLRVPLHALSGGQLQRVLLARALVKNPEVLVLDEPAQNLDISQQLEFYKRLERIYQARQCAILMVSHDLHLVMASTKKVVCLYRHICCSGEPQTVVRDPEFIALFGQETAQMMAVYHHEHDHTHGGACVH